MNVAILRRVRPSWSTLTAAIELLGVACIAYGLHAIYAPLMWFWLGLACFGVSYVLEAAQQRQARADHDEPAGVREERGTLTDDDAAYFARGSGGD